MSLNLFDLLYTQTTRQDHLDFYFVFPLDLAFGLLSNLSQEILLNKKWNVFLPAKNDLEKHIFFV